MKTIMILAFLTLAGVANANSSCVELEQMNGYIYYDCDASYMAATETATCDTMEMMDGSTISTCEETENPSIYAYSAYEGTYDDVDCGGAAYMSDPVNDQLVDDMFNGK